jgi:hypothetical protein
MKTSDYPALFWRRRGEDAGKTELIVELAAPLDDAGGDLIDSAIEVFCTAAALGAFCEESAAPGSCICRVLSSDRPSGRVQFELECRGIDHRAFQVLRNMLAKLNEEGVRARELSIRSTSIRLPEVPVAPLIDEDNEDEAYPPLHRGASVEVADEDVGGSWFRRCVVMLRAPVGQAQVDALGSLASPWFDVLEAGGYAMPLDFPWDVECVGDTVAQFEEDSMEVTVLRFQASEEAWCVLGNLIFMNATALGLAVERVVVDA